MTQAVPSADSPAVATEFYNGCIKQSTMGLDACTWARGNISADITTAKRAAKLCVAMGACRTSLACKVPSNTTAMGQGANNTLVDLDLCTRQGVVGGASILPAVNTTGVFSHTLAGGFGVGPGKQQPGGKFTLLQLGVPANHVTQPSHALLMLSCWPPHRQVCP